MSEKIVSDFLAANDIGTVEALIGALPPLHKSHFIALHSSESPAAAHVSSTYPRIVSWGADSRFIVTWTTDPASPSHQQVEFLQPKPSEGKWIAGVIDFSGDKPVVSKPAVCSTCHSSINRPIWAGELRVSGTEEDNSSAAVALYATMATSTSPRIALLETGQYKNPPAGGRFIPGIVAGQDGERPRQRERGDPSWAFDRAILLRQAEVLFARLMARDDGERIFLNLISKKQSFAKIGLSWYVRNHWDARILSGTGQPVRGWSKSEVQGSFRSYRPAKIYLQSAVQFLAMREALRRSENVRAIYRSHLNKDVFGDLTLPLGLHHPAGEATAEEEFLATWNALFQTSGQAHLDARLRRSHPFTGSLVPFGLYNEYSVGFLARFGLYHKALQAYRAPPPPSSPVLTSVTPGQRSLTVEWSAPTGADADKIERYEARTIPGDAPDKADRFWTLHSDAWTSGPLRYTVSGLAHDASYDVQVRAAGWASWQAPSGWSASSSGRTLPNRPPVGVGTLEPLALRVGDGGRVVDVAGAFRDDDGDVLTYAAVSGAPEIVSAAVSGAGVTLTPLASGSATVRITATDAAGSNTAATQTLAVRVKGARGVTVSKSTLAVTEGSTAEYTVVLDAAPDEEVTVTPVAPAGTDVSVEPASLTFGETTWNTPQTVVVSAASDADAVSDAAVLIEHRLTGGGYGSVTAPSVRALIVEKDTPALSSASSSAMESAGTVVFLVEISMASNEEVTVDFATLDGSASSGPDGDFVPSSGRLRFAPMSTAPRRVEVAVRDDTQDEGRGESFMLTLSNAVNAALAGGGQALSVTGTILDDDEPPPPAPPPSSPSPGPPSSPPSGPSPAPGPSPSPSPPVESLAAGFSIDPRCADDVCSAVTGEVVRFTDTSSGAVRGREWSFGDGGSSRGGSVAHAWSSPGFHEVTLTVRDGSGESRASRRFLVEAAAPAGSCAADEATRCLLDSRYAVTVEWRREGGEAAPAPVAPEGTNDSALFAFFDPDNWEVLVKVLDGCSTNGHMWVYGASTTDLGYAIRVTDTVTGAVREYRNEPGRPAPAIVDAKAFPGACD